MTLVDAVALSFLPGLPPDDLQAALHDAHPEVQERAARHRGRAAEAIAVAAARGITVVAWGAPEYPAPLAAIPDPPPVLWVYGVVDALARPAVAIVGSRAASAYALEVAESLAADLAACGITIVSGLARGVDSAAHRGALVGGGRTVAVLGSGVDRIYPPEHRRLADQIAAAHGAVASELAPGAAPLAWHFPRRNRIIAGLSLAVVVVEASEQSGSLITAHCALDQGREVMAVPGNVLSGRNRGSHALLKDGAKIVERADDILAELGLPTPGGAQDTGGTDRTGQTSDPVLARMGQGEDHDLDGLSALTGLAPRDLLPRLLALELAGQVRRTGAGRFVRASATC